MPAYESYMPSVLITRNFGMSSTTVGTLMTATRHANTTVRPRNRRRASAYPASELKKTRPTVTTIVTITEFLNQVGKSLFRNSCAYASVVNVCGTSESGFDAASGSVLKLVATWIRNG